MDHAQRQQAQSDLRFAHGSREHVTSTDPTVQYLVRWRLSEAVRRLRRHAPHAVSEGSSVLVLCAGEGFEGTVLCDLGFRDVTVSDISEAGVRAARERDPRLNTLQLSAEAADLPDGSFELVVIQDGLHHLQNPVRGFTEMLRIASRAALFLEPHDSLVGRVIGTAWEVNGEARNYVFRWDRRLVHDVAASYLGTDAFNNLSFSFWHHNVHYARLAERLGGGSASLRTIKVLKGVLDAPLGRFGNQFCGLLVKEGRQ
jgi:ubiquinone/menaquinone biosynthesis C-methylase UbiE